MLGLILSILHEYSQILAPIGTLIVGWLVPSPFQKKKKDEQAIEQSFDDAAKTGRP